MSYIGIDLSKSKDTASGMTVMEPTPVVIRHITKSRLGFACLVFGITDIFGILLLSRLFRVLLTLGAPQEGTIQNKGIIIATLHGIVSKHLPFFITAATTDTSILGIAGLAIGLAAILLSVVLNWCR